MLKIYTISVKKRKKEEIEKKKLEKTRKLRFKRREGLNCNFFLLYPRDKNELNIVGCKFLGGRLEMRLIYIR